MTERTDVASGSPAKSRLSRRNLMVAAGGIGLAAAMLESAWPDVAGADPQGIYAVTLGDATSYFRSVSGLGSETEVVEVVEGGSPNTVHKVPGRLKWPAIVLKNGVSSTMQLYNWRQMVIDSATNPSIPFRKDGSIAFLARSGTPIARWNFFRGWPSSLLAQGDDQGLMIETVEIANEGIQRVAV